jgi:acyl-CoA synthetase (AMP-forming)/AMP-acid ligase II
VAAVVQPRPGAALALEPIQTHCRTLLAGYKVPRQLHVVETIQRSPSGKPDYPWALRAATATNPAATPAGPT